MEHKLTAAEAEYLKLAGEEAARLSSERLAALGRARDLETALAALGASRDQQLAIICKNAGIGPGRVSLSADGLWIIVEDTGAGSQAGSDAAMIQPAASGLVNGVAHA